MPAVKPAGDVEVQRGSYQGSVHGGGDRGGEQARAQVNIVDRPTQLIHIGIQIVPKT